MQIKGPGRGGGSRLCLLIAPTDAGAVDTQASTLSPCCRAVSCSQLCLWFWIAFSGFETSK